jgi:hypothetical protein
MLQVIAMKRRCVDSHLQTLSRQPISRNASAKPAVQTWILEVGNIALISMIAAPPTGQTELLAGSPLCTRLLDAWMMRIL